MFRGWYVFMSTDIRGVGDEEECGSWDGSSLMVRDVGFQMEHQKVFGPKTNFHG